MHSAGGPDMLVEQLAPATPQPKAKKQLTFESSQSSPKGSVVRQLSFASADTSSPASQPEKDSLVKKASFDSAPPSQSPEDAEQIAPASPSKMQKPAPSKEQRAQVSPQHQQPSQLCLSQDPPLSLESQGRIDTGSPMGQGSSCTQFMLLRMRRLLAQWAKAS